MFDLAILVNFAAIGVFSLSLYLAITGVQDRKSKEAERKAEIYAESKQKIARIEAGVEKYGYELDFKAASAPSETSGSDFQNSEISALLSNPAVLELAQKFLSQTAKK